MKVSSFVFSCFLFLLLSLGPWHDNDPGFAILKIAAKGLDEFVIEGGATLGASVRLNKNLKLVCGRVVMAFYRWICGVVSERMGVMINLLIGRLDCSDAAGVWLQRRILPHLLFCCWILTQGGNGEFLSILQDLAWVRRRSPVSGWPMCVKCSLQTYVVKCVNNFQRYDSGTGYNVFHTNYYHVFRLITIPYWCGSHLWAEVVQIQTVTNRHHLTLNVSRFVARTVHPNVRFHCRYRWPGQQGRDIWRKERCVPPYMTSEIVFWHNF